VYRGVSRCLDRRRRLEIFKFFSLVGGGSKFLNFFHLSPAAGKFENEKFF